MNSQHFRRIALAMDGVVEGAHMGHPDFRLGKRIFATIHGDKRFGMVKLTPEQQQQFLRDHPGTFAPEPGAWGRYGCTSVRLDSVDEETLGQAITIAWQNLTNEVKARRSGSKRAAAAAARARKKR